MLRFAYDAGITDRRARRLIRDLSLPIGVGMFGTTVSRRQLTVTDDYPVDKRFEHLQVADEIVRAAGMRSMAVTPLVAGERVIGAMGAYANRPAAFSEAQIRLLRALGDHAATAIANRQQAAELALRVETQRTLQKLAAQITAIRDPDELLQQVVDGAQRLIGSDGAPPDSPRSGGADPAAARHNRRPGRGDPRVPRQPGASDRRRHERAGGRAGRRRLDARLPGGSAHPAYGGRPGGGGAHGPAGHGRRAAACSGRRDLRHARHFVGARARHHARRRSSCCRAWPTSPPSPSPTPGCTSR